jgi:hypothetical protein
VLVRILLWILAIVALPSCTYARDRALDFTDIVDVKYGTGGHGFGIKVRASEILGTGVGVGEWKNIVEFVGRRANRDFSKFFAIGVFGLDYSNRMEEYYFTVFRIPRYSRNTPVTALRFGGELMLPFVRGGLFLSVGEILDFVLGFTTLDIANDDGLASGAPLDATPESHPIGGTEEEE